MYKFDDDEPNWCCYLNAQPTQEPRLCENAPTAMDSVGYTWCQAHRYRGDMLDMAKERNWPEVRFQMEGQERYRVIGYIGSTLLFCLLHVTQPDGAFYWIIAALYLPEEYVLEAFAALATPEEMGDIAS